MERLWVKYKTIVIRAIAILLMVFSLFFSYTWPGGYCIGDSFLGRLGLKAWSNGAHGTHYTFLYSLGILLVAFFVYSQTTRKKLMSFLNIVCGFIILFFLANIAF